MVIPYLLIEKIAKMWYNKGIKRREVLPIKRKIFTMFDEEKQKSNSSKGKVSTLSYTVSIAGAALFGLILAVLLTTFVGFISNVSGRSMVPTLQDGDVIIAEKSLKNLERGDIVVVDISGRENHEGLNHDLLVKRVMGLPGDVVEVNPETSEAIINGEPLDEPYIVHGPSSGYDNMGPVTVPDGYVFVMGDNRPGSLDSRDSNLGFVSINEIKGRFVLRFWPLGERE